MLKTKKAPEFEYRMTIAQRFNERQQVPTTLITLETTKIFASFRYDLSVEETIDGNELRYMILGLKTPQLSLPASGTARFSREYSHLKGKCEIVVESLDGTTNEFAVNIAKNKIKILKSPKSPFIELVAT